MFCGQTIYVVDDDKPALHSLSLLLTAKGYAVRSHESAETFLDAIKQNERGCVITDARMPGMSGLDLLAVMKERRVSMPVTGLFSPLIFWWLWDSFRRECVNLSATARIGGCRHANAAAGDFTRNSGSSSR
jgi:DNA-binding LytR/AlgR family response regulator